jgi:nucleotide-binding universal stress UspA family protein
MSEHADRAIRNAFDIARQFGSEVFLLHVIKDPVRQCTVDYCLEEEQFAQLRKRMNESARQDIRRRLEIFPYFDSDKVTIHVKTGTPSDEILKEAAETDADLIVMPPSASAGLARFLGGRIARHVMQKANCQVLMTK